MFRHPLPQHLELPAGRTHRGANRRRCNKGMGVVSRADGDINANRRLARQEASRSGRVRRTKTSILERLRMERQCRLPTIRQCPDLLQRMHLALARAISTPMSGAEPAPGVSLCFWGRQRSSNIPYGTKNGRAEHDLRGRTAITWPNALSDKRHLDIQPPGDGIRHGEPKAMVEMAVMKLRPAARGDELSAPKSSSTGNSADRN